MRAGSGPFLPKEPSLPSPDLTKKPLGTTLIAAADADGLRVEIRRALRMRCELKAHQHDRGECLSSDP